jgi:hypothetical protein
VFYHSPSGLADDAIFNIFQRLFKICLRHQSSLDSFNQHHRPTAGPGSESRRGTLNVHTSSCVQCAKKSKGRKSTCVCAFPSPDSHWQHPHRCEQSNRDPFAHIQSCSSSRSRGSALHTMCTVRFMSIEESMRANSNHPARVDQPGSSKPTNSLQKNRRMLSPDNMITEPLSAHSRHRLIVPSVSYVPNSSKGSSDRAIRAHNGGGVAEPASTLTLRGRSLSPVKIIRFPLPRIDEDTPKTDVQVGPDSAWMNFVSNRPPIFEKPSDGSMMNARVPRSTRSLD